MGNVPSVRTTVQNDLHTYVTDISSLVYKVYCILEYRIYYQVENL